VKWFALAAILICTILFGWSIWYDRSLRDSDPVGYRNVKTCFDLEPGIAEADLVRALGAPERSEEDGSVRRLTFHTLSAASAPIRAEVDPADGRVLELRCRDDEKPTWTVRP